jgi:hypothetical protein
VLPGKEEELMTLVRTVGAPVRDKLMADGVVLAMGPRDSPVALTRRADTRNLVFRSDLEGVEKVLNGMEAQLAKLAAEVAKAAETARSSKQKRR